jgi:ABC-2 type transport system permease protein
VTTIDLNEYDVPGRSRGILDVIRWRYLLTLLVRKGTATRYRNSTLGWTWSYVKPLIQFGIYFLVMGFIFGQRPVAAIINAFIHFLPQLAILLIVAILYGWRPGFGEIGAVLAGLVMIALIAFGLGLLFAGLNVRFRDAENFAEVIRQLATWASPVLYTWQLIPDKMGPIFGHIYMCNPITIAVEFMHYGFWAETVDRFSAANPGGWIGFPPHFSLYVLVAVVASILLLVIGQAVFRRFERTFAQDL